MKLAGSLLCIILVIIENNNSAHSYQPGAIFCHPGSRRYPLRSCVSLCYMINGQAFAIPHRDGIPCLFKKWGQWTIGQCSKGVCTAMAYPRPKPCDNVYRGEGYTSNCSYTCSQGRYGPRLVYYSAGTACIHINAKGVPIGGPGICRAGKCVRYDELDESEIWAAEHIFHEKYHKCKDKENSAKIVLSDCRHYCRTDSGLFFGYYGSGYDNSCFLFDRAEPHRHGWCCRGKCIREAHCNGTDNRRLE
uniref:Putative basic tail protein n=1 Tax=Amblyomma parvum TaxID=251391 RepID=A0A023G311_AMBPA